MVLGRLTFLLGLVLCFSFSARAASRTQSRFILDLGGYVDNIEQRLSAPAGYATEVSNISGFARIRYDISLGSRWYLEPQFAVMLPWRTSVDGGTKTFVTHFDLDLSIPLFSFLSFRTGTGVYNTLVWGTGNGVELNNGSPTNTDTFYAPDAILVSFSLLAHAGLQFNLSDNWFFNLDAYGLQIMSASRRSIHGAASIGLAL